MSIRDELPAFEEWFVSVWAGELPTIQDSDYGSYLESRQLALGAWMHRAMLDAAPTPPAPQDDEALEVLRALLDEQDGPPLIRRAQQWQAAVDAARALLTKRGAA